MKVVDGAVAAADLQAVGGGNGFADIGFALFDGFAQARATYQICGDCLILEMPSQ